MNGKRATTIIHILAALLTLLLCSCDPYTGEDEKGKKFARTKPSENTSPLPGDTEILAETPVPTATFLHNPVDIVQAEIVPDAIPVWRRYTHNSPTLVLLSQNPFLHNPPPAKKEEIRRLLRDGNLEDFRSLARLSRPDPVLPMQQTVRACLQEEFFGELLWILPTNPGQGMDVEYPEVLAILVASGAISKKESESFVQEDGELTGTLEGTPVTITTLDGFDTIAQATILHFDLSFFTSPYVSAVKTPIHGLVNRTLHTLRDRALRPYAVTLSKTTGQNLVPLKFRFLAADLKKIAGEPQILDKPLPSNWKTRQNILYLEYFFQPKETRNLVDQLLRKTPKDPWVYYWDYLLTAQNKEVVKALATLAHAVDLDSGYADEYLALADRARKRKMPSQALEFLAKALVAYPENVFIELQMLDLEMALHLFERAQARIDRLKKLDWSPLYHPTIPALLDEMQAIALNPLADLDGDGNPLAKPD